MEPITYRALPVEVQAVVWTGDFGDLPRHWRTKNQLHMVGGRLIVETVHGPLPAEVGDILVLGVSNEFYPMPRATFAYRYAAIVDGVAVSDELVELALRAYDDGTDPAPNFFSMRAAIAAVFDALNAAVES